MKPEFSAFFDSPQVQVVHLTDQAWYGKFEMILKVKLCAKDVTTHPQLLSGLMQLVDFIGTTFQLPAQLQSDTKASRKRAIDKYN